MPLWVPAPEYHHDCDNPAPRFQNEDKVEKPLIDIPLQRARPWPKRALKSPAISLRSPFPGLNEELRPQADGGICLGSE